jgi:hypothetical protein
MKGKTMNSKAQSISAHAIVMVLLTLLSTATSPLLRAACCGDLDTSFNPYYGANNTVYASVRLSDNKFIIGGAFTSYEQATRYYLARLTATTGGNDPSYSAAVNGTVYDLAIDGSDGTERLVAVGSFTYANFSFPVNGIARFLASGSYDTNFSSPIIDVPPIVVRTLGDGKILIGGYHNCVGGYYRPRIARLNADGSVDPTFNAGAINGGVTTIGFASGLFIGGEFTSVGGYPRGHLARLDSSTGNIDTAWPDTGLSLANGAVYAIEFDQSGRTVIGGAFTQFNGQTTGQYLVRVDYGGNVVATPAAALNGPVRVAKHLMWSGDECVIGGEFTMVGSTLARGLARMSAGLGLTCSADTGFTGGTAPTSVRTIIVLPESGVPVPTLVFCSGNFTYYKGVSRNRVAQVFVGCSF